MDKTAGDEETGGRERQKRQLRDLAALDISISSLPVGLQGQQLHFFFYHGNNNGNNGNNSSSRPSWWEGPVRWG